MYSFNQSNQRLLDPKFTYYTQTIAAAPPGRTWLPKATKYTCDRLREEFEIKVFIRNFLIKG
jgi:hypothetical protein